MRSTIYCLLALLWPVVNGFCQEPPGKIIKPLSVGDTVPDIELSNVYNYPTSKIRLSDLKGKLIIIDFWASWCGNCISLFPHLDSLQRKFGDRLQIILFNTKSRASHDDEPKIKRIITSLENRTGQKISLPIAYDSEELDNYFPCEYVPHEVWLNADGKVIAITSHVEVTEQNIAALLDNKNIQLHTKNDVLDYDRSKPLFVNNNGGSGDDFIYRSILTGYREGLFGTIVRRSKVAPDKLTGMSLLNVPLPTLLKAAYAGTGKLDYPNNRRIIDTRNTRQFKIHEDSGIYRYSYCYDISGPPMSLQALHKNMQADMERSFHITLRNAKRKLNCWILKKDGTARIAFSKARNQDLEYRPGSLKKYLHGCRLSEVVRFFDLRLERPLIDETSLSPDLRIDIELPFDLKNQGALISALKNAGFSVTPQIREVDVAVISDK